MNTPILRNTELLPINRIITRRTSGEPVPPGMRFRRDLHPHREILLCLQGTCIYPINGRLFRLEQGTAVMLDAWCPHAYGYRECDRDFAHVWYSMGDHAMLYQVNAQGKRIPQNISLHITAAVRDLVLARWQAAETGDDDAPPYLLTALNALQEDMFALPERERTPRRHDAEAVSVVQSVIRRRSGRDCSLARLAEETGYSACHLAHLVQHHTGKTIGRLIDEARRDFTVQAHAHGLIQKEIAAHLGFSSAAAFGNWLRRQRNYLIGSKSAAPCLHSGQTKSAGSSSPS